MFLDLEYWDLLAFFFRERPHASPHLFRATTGTAVPITHIPLHHHVASRSTLSCEATL